MTAAAYVSGERRTDRQTDGHHHCIKPPLLWQGLDSMTFVLESKVRQWYVSACNDCDGADGGRSVQRPLNRCWCPSSRKHRLRGARQLRLHTRPTVYKIIFISIWTLNCYFIVSRCKNMCMLCARKPLAEFTTSVSHYLWERFMLNTTIAK